MKILIIGLDGATFDVIKPMIKSGELKTFQYLMKMGCWGYLQSTIPPLSPVAWSSFATGTNPGKHGIYDFIMKEKGTYNFQPINSTSRRELSFWKILSLFGKRAGIINVPSTYPPERLDGGFMISGFPNSESGDHVYPKSLEEEIRIKFGELKIQPATFYTEENEENFIQDQYRSWKNTEKIFLNLMKTKEWDLFLVVFKAPDDLGHGLWKYFDESFHKQGNEDFIESRRESFLGIYRLADELLSRIVTDMSEEGTHVFIVSDHGLGPLRKTIILNNWLMERHYLSLKKTIPTRVKSFLHNLGFVQQKFFILARKLGLQNIIFQHAYLNESKVLDLKRTLFLSLQDIDWSRTKAYSIGNFGYVYLNLKDREPEGTIKKEEYKDVIKEISKELKGIKGGSLFSNVWTKYEIYNGDSLEYAPDIIIESKNYECMPQRFFEFGSNQLLIPNVIGRTGGHKNLGIFLAYGPEFRKGMEIKDLKIIDLAPTILYMMNFPIPERMDGKVIKELFREGSKLASKKVVYKKYKRKIIFEGEGKDYSKEDIEKIEKRLRMLGYI